MSSKSPPTNNGPFTFPPKNVSRGEDVPDSPHRSVVPRGSMKVEANRLKTFENVWSVEFIQSAELAGTGFYFHKPPDTVKCAFCKGMVGRFEEGDTPFEEHKKHFPNCPFIRGLPVGNVPLNCTADVEEEQEVDQHVVRGYDVCGRHVITKKNSTIEKETPFNYGTNVHVKTGPSSGLGLHEKVPPHYPEFSSYQSRLQTYKHWTSAMPQNPHDLCLAGLFYTGKSDHTCCFTCGGIIGSWEPSDVPEVEHVKHYPDCAFMLLTKGAKFIQEVSKGQQAPASTESEYKARLEEMMSMKIVEDALATSIIDQEMAEHLVKLRISNNLGPYSSVDELVNEYLDIQDDQTSGFSSAQLNLKNKKAEGSPERKNTALPKTGDAKSKSKIEDELTRSVSPSQVNLLAEENARLKEERLCKVCLDRTLEVVFLPCGHLATCTDCAAALTNCPICRIKITGYVKAFLP